MVRVVADHERARGPDPGPAFDDLEAQPARRRPVVEEAVTTQVVGDVDVGEEVAVEVGGRQPEGPAAEDLLGQDVADFPEAVGILRGGLPPEQEVQTPAVAGPAMGVVHLLDAARVGIVGLGAVGKVVAQDQVEAPVAVEVGLNRGRRVPALVLAGRGELLGLEVGRGQLPSGVALAQEEQRSAPEEVDEDVRESVLVPVAHERSAGPDIGPVVPSHGEREGGVARRRSRGRADDDLLRAGLRVDEVVGEAVPVEVGQGDPGADGRDPLGDPLAGGVGGTERLGRDARDSRELRSDEAEPVAEGPALDGRGHLGRPRHHKVPTTIAAATIAARRGPSTRLAHSPLLGGGSYTTSTGRLVTEYRTR